MDRQIENHVGRHESVENMEAGTVPRKYWRSFNPVRGFNAICRIIRLVLAERDFQRFAAAVKTTGWRVAVRKALRRLKSLRPAGSAEGAQPPSEWSPAQRYIGNGGIPQNSYESHFEPDEDFGGRKSDIRILAFYLPQFHTFPENDRWWGKGFTEWTNTRKAKPQFPSHYQPREPHDDIGYYDLSDYHTLEKQAAMLKKHGIYGLCIYHYWFSGKRLMEKPVDLLLAHPEIDLRFCLCWANENWTRAWDGLAENILIAQKHENDDVDYIRDLKPYLMDPRYIRVDGKPLVLVYRPGILPDAAKTFRRWREWARENGIGEIRILVVRGCANQPESMMIEGADGEVEFPPAYTALPQVLKATSDGIQILNYPGYVNEIISGRGCTERYPHPVYRGAMLGWDCTPRRKAFHCWYGFSPEWYYRWLRYNIEWTRRHHDENDRFVFINAWNEWAEGTYLEPDRLFGYTNLNTTSRALFDLPLPKNDSAEALAEARAVVSQSPYFDRAWYLKQYPDVGEVGMDPLEHYIQSGWKEGRSPSEYFPGALYLFFLPEFQKGQRCSIVDFRQRGLTGEHLLSLTRRFDEIQARTRKLLKVDLLVPPPLAVGRKLQQKTVAVHLHCFYRDMIPEICGYLASIPCRFDLFVSLPEGREPDSARLEEEFRNRIPNLGALECRVVPNRGRDLAPFLVTFGKTLGKYDYFCHIHTKKSLHTPAHACWAEFIYRHLFASREWVERIFALLEDGADTVYPADFLMMREEPSGWGSDLAFAQNVVDRFGLKANLKHDLPVIEFPQGSMLWGRSEALSRMFSLELDYEDFPAEPLGTDGSVAHALERLFFVWNMEGTGRNCQIFLPGEEEMIRRRRYWFRPLESDAAGIPPGSLPESREVSGRSA